MPRETKHVGRQKVFDKTKSRAEARGTMTEVEAEIEDEEEDAQRPTRRSAPVAKRRETTASKNGHVKWATNDLCVEGNLGADPELRVTGDGVPVTSFRMAIYQGGSKDNPKDPVWMSCTCWEDLAEEVEKEYKKGDRVRIWGHLTQRKYESRGGETHTSTEITFDHLEYVPPILRREIVNER